MSRSVAFAVALVALSALGCAEAEEPAAGKTADTLAATPPHPDAKPTRRDTLTATLHDPAGAEVGRATLIGTPNGVLVTATLDGLPAGTHAFHLHETGACAPDFGAAGGHLNPDGAAHGMLDPAGPHAGDLPNVTMPATGSTTVSAFARDATIDALVDADGSAVVLHAGADDYATDPAGAAGDRIACGPIEAARDGAAVPADTADATSAVGP